MTSEPKAYPYRWVILAVFYDGQFDPSSFFNIDFLAMVYAMV